VESQCRRPLYSKGEEFYDRSKFIVRVVSFIFVFLVTSFGTWIGRRVSLRGGRVSNSEAHIGAPIVITVSKYWSIQSDIIDVFTVTLSRVSRGLTLTITANV
jgi:hypothetical protein